MLALLVSLVVHWCKMRRTRIREDAGGAYRPVSGGGADVDGDPGEQTGAGKNNNNSINADVDAEYGETGDDEPADGDEDGGNNNNNKTLRIPSH